jgi:hypothetical protein
MISISEGKKGDVTILDELILGKRPMWCLLTEFSRVIVFVRDFCSDVYAALAEGRRDLAQASGVMAGI